MIVQLICLILQSISATCPQTACGSTSTDILTEKYCITLNQHRLVSLYTADKAQVQIAPPFPRRASCADWSIRRSLLQGASHSLPKR